MNAALSITDNVAQMEAELSQLREEKINHIDMIDMLKTQMDQVNADFKALKDRTDEELRIMRFERDTALRKAREVGNILEGASSMVMQGLRKMKGDETPLAPETATDTRLPAASFVEGQ